MKLLLIGSLEIMMYVRHLEKNFDVNTFKSLSNKCNNYELDNLDKNNVNNMNIIIVLDNSLINKLEELLSNDSSVSDIFSLTNLKINNNKIKIHKTIKISKILEIIDNNSGPLEIVHDKSKITNIQPSNSNINNKLTIKREPFDVFSNICIKKLNDFRKLELPNIPIISDKKAVYIEFRRFPHSEVLIRNCIHKLGKDWSHTIITGPENYSYYLNMSKRINNNIEVININLINVTHNDYNNLLLNSNFWNKLSGEKILIYQSDSFIFKNNISEFLEWDYIGSPFPKKELILATHQVGNGGLSIRSKSKMLEVLEKVTLNDNNYSKIVNNYKKSKNLDNYPEDIVFSQNMQQMGIGRVANYETAKSFSVDLVYQEDSFGIHCMWNGNNNWEEIFCNIIKKNANLHILNTKIDAISSNPVKAIIDDINKNNTNNNINKSIVILSHNKGGGLSKYVNDLLNFKEYLHLDFNNYNFVSNQKNLLDKNYMYYTDHDIIYYLNNTYFEDLILHLNGNFLDYNDILKLINNLKANKLKIVITIHDFYWFLCNSPNSYNNEDLLDGVFENNVIEIFKKSDIIIFPSERIVNIYKKVLSNTNTEYSTKNIIIDKIILSKHIDIYYYNINRYKQTYKDNLNIVFLGRTDKIKGYDNLQFIIDNLKMSHFNINIFVIGNIYTKIEKSTKNITINYINDYDEHNLCSIINDIKPHLFLLLSNCYETWSYVTSFVLYTGLPIFYYEDVYNFRIDKNKIKYVYSYSCKSDIIEKFIHCIDSLTINTVDNKEYTCLNLDYYNDYYIPNLYRNLYGKLLNSKNLIIKPLNNSDNSIKKQPKDKNELNIFAIYFPQFHRIKENDISMYKNYTDFTNMDKINDSILKEKNIKTPLFGQYDLLADEDIIQNQIEIATRYNLKGFAVYHYWFDTNLLGSNNNIMGNVETQFLNIKNDDFSYFFIWANEKWNNNLFNLNEISKENWQKHFNELLIHFNNKNYLKIDNKPVFYILHYWLFDEHILSEMISYFNTKLIENNFAGIYIGLCLNFDIPLYKTINCDYYINTPAWKNANKFGMINTENNECIVNYEYYLNNFEDELINSKNENINHNIVLNMFPGFNNFVRNYCKKTNISTYKYINATNENFIKYLDKIKKLTKKYTNKNNMLLINAWNEWGENMVIEPSNETGFSYLEQIKERL